MQQTMCGLQSQKVLVPSPLLKQVAATELELKSVRGGLRESNAQAYS